MGGAFIHHTGQPHGDSGLLVGNEEETSDEQSDAEAGNNDIEACDCLAGNSYGQPARLCAVCVVHRCPGVDVATHCNEATVLGTHTLARGDRYEESGVTGAGNSEQLRVRNQKEQSDELSDAKASDSDEQSDAEVETDSEDAAAWTAIREQFKGLPAKACDRRNSAVMQQLYELVTVDSPEHEAARRGARKWCSQAAGQLGFIETCCSVHKFETSGYGNQVLQLVHAFRWTRMNRCAHLCLPDCEQNLELPQCGGKEMDQGNNLHIVAALNLSTSIAMPPEIAIASDLPEPELEPNYEAVGCLDEGWPYCFFDVLQWPQARSDIAHVLDGAFEPLPEDMLVMHLRSGDEINLINDWLTEDAVNAQFSEQDDIYGAPMQPPCGYYIDVALTGLNGGAFRKVHLMADMNCWFDDDETPISRDVVAAPEGCTSVNPCIEEIVKALPRDMLILPRTNTTNLAAFLWDTGLIAATRNIALACSTFSVFGRLTSNHLQRLFAPQCQLRYDVEQSKRQHVAGHGRRRDTARREGFGGTSRSIFFHEAWEVLSTTEPSSGRLFSQDEPDLIVNWYEFDYQNHPIMQAVFGPAAIKMSEWKRVTNSSSGRPLRSLLTSLEWTKQTILTGGHTNGSQGDRYEESGVTGAGNSEQLRVRNQKEQSDELSDAKASDSDEQSDAEVETDSEDAAAWTAIREQFKGLPAKACGRRNSAVMQQLYELVTVDSPEHEAARRGARKWCSQAAGQLGFIETCCSVHKFETSGYGDQVLQLVHAFRWTRMNRCAHLCLPDCEQNLELPQCGGKEMDQGNNLHIVAALNLSTSIAMPPEIAIASDLPEPELEPNYEAVGCLDEGWPYCFFDVLQWPQARSDIAHVLDGAFEPLPEDMLVMHLRSGDEINLINDWLTEDAVNAQFSEQDDIYGAPMQPPCGYYIDVALTGLNGGAFRKVHLMADMNCWFDDDETPISRDVVAAPEGCTSVNPCIEEIVKALPRDMLILPRTNTTNLAAFLWDTGLIAATRNIALACSTFSVFGRLTSNHLQRLFAPQCQLRYDVEQSKRQHVAGHGRRRDTAQREGFGGTSRSIFFHNAWQVLSTTEPSSGRLFSQDEPDLIVNWYEFDYQNHPIMQAVFGPATIKMSEWKRVTNSSSGRPLRSLLTSLEWTKQTILTGGHTNGS